MRICLWWERELRPPEEQGLRRKLVFVAVVCHDKFPDKQKSMSVTLAYIRLKDGGIHGLKCGATYNSE